MIGIPQSEVLRAASRERRSQPRQRSPSRSAVGGYPVSINRGQRLNSRAAILRSKKRDGDGSHPRLKRAPRSLAGAGGAIVEAASQRVTRLARGGGPPNASPSNRRMPELTCGIGTAMALVSMNFGPQNCGAVSECLPRTRYGEDGRRLLQFFQWVLIFEQSINHGRGPRWWPQIGAAATWLRPSAR